MPSVKVTAAKNSGNTTVFNLVDSDGVPVDLTALGATVACVTICGGRYSCGSLRIDSSTDAVTFAGSTLSVKFGQLQADPQAQPYYPKISYVSPACPDGEVIAGEGYETQIQLTAVC